jgi:hypothetical protein
MDAQPAVSQAPTFAPEIQELIDIANKLNREGFSGVIGIARHALNLYPKKSPCRVIQFKRAET